MRKPNEKQQLLAITAELNRINRNFEMLRKIVTTEGFRQTWFEMLPNYKSGPEAFNALNEIYFNLTNPHKYRYSSYNAFLVVLNHKKK